MGIGIFLGGFGICEYVVDVVDSENRGELPLPHGESCAHVVEPECGLQFGVQHFTCNKKDWSKLQ